MIIVLYENEDWLVPLVSSLKKKNLPYQTHFVNGGQIDISRTPEKAVYINRMSPSSHTRGHMDGVLFMREYLSVLEAHGMPIINGSNSFSFELSKVRQHSFLEAFGIQTPRTIATVGMDHTIRIWNYLTWECEILFDTGSEDGPPMSISLHPSGFHLVVGFKERVRMYNILRDTVKELRSMPIKNCRELKFNNGGNMFAAGECF